MKNSRSLKLLIAGVVGVLVLAYIVFLRLLVPEIVVAESRRGNAVRAVTGTVTVIADIETEIISTGSGFLKESHLREGAVVAQGQQLAVIDPGQLPFDIEASRIEIARLENIIERGSPRRFDLARLKRELTQAEDLLKARHISQSEYDKTLLAYQVLEAQIQDEENQLRTNRDLLVNTVNKNKDLLGRLTIAAPMEGQIVSVHAYPGDLLATGRSLARLISLSRRISAEVNQDDIAVIRVGSPAQVRFFAYGNQLFEGRVERVHPSSDPTTQRFTVYVSLENPPAELFPGTTGEVVFYAGENADTIIVPRRALMGSALFVVEGGRVRVRKVEPGFLSYSEAEIVKGLAEGETVLVENLDQFRDGDRVRVARVVER